MVKSPNAYRHAEVHDGRRMNAASVAAVILLIAMVCLAAGPAWAGEPEVNGLFYGDGDVDNYPSTPYATSVNGSELYVRLINGTLYVALVVSRTVNDNVFDSGNGTDYLDSAGWGGGGNTTACRRIDSEFAEFTLEVGDAFAFNWQQGYAGQPDSQGGGNPCSRYDRTNATWISDETVGGGLGTPPPGIDSASSLMWNLNNYADNLGSLNWSMPGTDTDAGSWKSPWVGADESGTPPEDTSSVIDANEGYPATGQITYSPTYEWEWPMVYEWSVDMTQFGANPVFVVTGSSHHSPSKTGEEDDDFPPQEDPDPLMDFGDLPHDGMDYNYATLLEHDGARHVQDTSFKLQLGENIDDNGDGRPTDAADGDDNGDGFDDEDGVVLPDSTGTNDNEEPGLYTTTVTATNDSGTGTAAMLCAWFDMDRNGTFENTPNTSTTTADPDDGNGTDSGERSCVSVPDETVDGEFSVEWTIPEELYDDSGEFYLRYRIWTDAGDSLAPSPAGRYENGEVEDYRVSIVSLPVSLNSFESRLTGPHLRVEWTTASETFNVGFDLWARVDDEWLRLTDEPILSKATDAVTPGEYRTRITLEDIDPRAIQGLALSSIETTGQQELYGTFEIGESYGDTALPEPIAWDVVRAEHDAAMVDKGYEQRGGKWRQARRNGAANSSSSASKSVMELRVTEAGMQRVTYEDLKSSGLDLAGLRPNAIAVTLKGEGVARHVNPGRGNGLFGPGGTIDFWGARPDYPDALYVADYFYRVEVNPDAAIPAGREMRRAKDGQARALHPLRVNEDVAYSFVNATEDPWHAAMLMYPWGPRQYNATVQVDDALVDGEPGRVEVTLTAFSDFPRVDPDHRIRLLVNGEAVAEEDISGHRAVTMTASVPAGIIGRGDNIVTVELPGGTAAPYDIVTVDTAALWYPRAFEAHDDRLLVEGEVTGSGLRAAGFTSGNVVAYARHAAGELSELRVDTKRAKGGWEATVPTAAGRSSIEDVQYWISSSSSLIGPELIGTVEQEDLLDEPADYLLIVHPSFLPDGEDASHPLNRFIDRRESQGWSVRAVGIDAVQNAYGGGMPLPGAVTNFLAAAQEAFEYTHVLLVGDDTYDYRNKLGLGTVSFVPTMYADVNSIHHSPSDGLMTDLDGDGISDKAVGRWPVRSLTDLDVMVRKTLDWEDAMDGPRSSRSSVWVTDSADPKVPSFEDQAERMIGTLQTPLAGDASEAWPADNVTRIFYDSVEPLPGQSASQAARAQLMEALAAGQTVTGFAGHGSPTSWTFQGLLNARDVKDMHNEGSPTLISTLTCYTTYFVSPYTNTLAHRLMAGYRVDGQGKQVPGAANGAVAVHGAATLSGYTDNESLARATLQHQLDNGDTLGEAIRKARREAAAAGQVDTATNWALLGDPTLTIEP